MYVYNLNQYIYTTSIDTYKLYCCILNYKYICIWVYIIVEKNRSKLSTIYGM